MRNASYVSGYSEKPLIGQTIGDLFDEVVDRFPEREVLVSSHQGLRYTYAQFSKEVNTAARAFMALGVKRGDRIGIWSPNRAEWTVVQIATAKIGAILVNINPAYRLHELEYALKQSGCSWIVIAAEFKYSNYTNMVIELLPELADSAPGELKSPKVPDLRGVIRLHDEKVAGMLRWMDFMSLAGDVSSEQLKQRQGKLDFDDPINIQYTSGTTGFPKGATLSHHNILNNAFFVGESMKLTEYDRAIVPVPLYHCFGMVIGNLGCISHGACIIYPSEGFDAELVLKTVEAERATVLHGVPTMFIAELDHEDFNKYDLRTLRTGIMAGAPCPILVMKEVQLKMYMHEVEIAYGLTEVSPVCTQTRPGTSIEMQVSTVGQVHPHLEIKIIDPYSGQILPKGEKGELCIRGYSVMKGYWNDAEKTCQTIDSTGWLHSGDLATMDDEGYVKIVGRIKEMIIRGGENIYPREIEEFLFSHPKVSEVQVIGVPDEKYGEELMAWIKVVESEQLTGEEVREFCKGKIAHFKIPRYYKFVTEFPMTVTGKIRKIEMREISVRELGLEKEAAIKTA
jgi:fatty-acyl-CoA synthase